MAGWGGAIETIGGMIDGLFGLSPEQQKVKIKNRIDKLEQEQKELTKGECNDKKSATYNRNKLELKQLQDKLSNLA